jgi:hypothetical protein
MQAFLHGSPAGEGEARARRIVQLRGHAQQRFQFSLAARIAGQAGLHSLALAQALNAIIQNSRDLH